MSDEPVGYGRPPRHSQFEKGRSGNPKGRPRGAKGFLTAVSDAANEKVRTTEKGRVRHITKREIAAKQLVNKSASGDLKALPILMGVFADIEAKLEIEAAQPVQLGEAELELMALVRARIEAYDQGEHDV